MRLTRRAAEPRPLTTQLVGSYAKPRWLIRHQRVTSPSSSFWRPDPDVLAESQDDATRLAIADQEHAGLGVITDGADAHLTAAGYAELPSRRCW